MPDPPAWPPGLKTEVSKFSMGREGLTPGGAPYTSFFPFFHFYNYLYNVLGYPHGGSNG